MYKDFFKNIVDRLLAFIALAFLSPLLFIVGIIIKLDSPGPVFFMQRRLGKNGRVFEIYKFRSMVNKKNNFVPGEIVVENSPKITKVGRFIRKTSIDEIPQVINILIGDMSFIGPRPPMELYPKKYEDYSEFEKIRFQVKPGMSGLAAIRAREINDWNLIIPVDVEYVQNLTASLDLKLFIKSLFVFFKTDNVYTKIS